MKFDRVIDKSGSTVECLYIRGGRTLTMMKMVAGKNYCRRIPHMARLAPGAKPTQQQIKEASAWIRQFEGDVLAERWDIIRNSKLKREVSTVGDIVAAYRRATTRLGRPTARTVEANIGSLAKVIKDALGVDSVDRQSSAVLSGSTIVKFAQAMLAVEDNDSRRRSIVSYLRQARSIFKDKLLEEYKAEGLTLPDLDGFLNRAGVEAPKRVVVQLGPQEIEILQKVRELRDSQPDVYAAWFLCYYLGLRAGEVAQARKSWLRQHQVTDVERAASDWLKDRTHVWVWDMGSDPTARLKREASAGIVPVADDVAAELLNIAGDREYVIPFDKYTARHDAVNRSLPKVMRRLGWTRDGEFAQAIRQYRYQVWARKYGELIAEMWLRHAIQGVRRFYDSPVYLTKQPLGLGE